ncbi:uncharacterized protein BCR38DRAFT_350804 [Pseudomassariella vexata]|uniref:Tetratricopeptide SHNi-TPR domain-containing protein n=1 Tax=Pseudomassariella vexata TaxID=1141098 RepID=A0A1Y2DJX5_9PEZI|nr:uncharacterized protein BCR38DRAFT_350804 [Pseudomassariella vexata]ORY59499.1 hypothetical protein BCR38DRAFT_350804 [Pseudomassariella vexata]
MDPEERAKSIKVSLADLTAKATALYAQKNYEEAAELFSQATETQAEFNGEMSPENADILFLYGRSLFKVGQSKSDVLGGKATGEEKKKKKSNGAAESVAKTIPPVSTGAYTAEKEKTKADEIAEEKVAIVAMNASGSGLKEDEKKPLFQFMGDEDFEDSDEDAGEDEDGKEEEEDDLAVAFEILDLSRVLFEKSLELAIAADVEGKGKEKSEGDAPTVRHIKERLADTHDLLAEISLENEKYPLAINDSRSSLKYKFELYPQESEIIAEAHFKLSLALEFASVTTTAEDNSKPEAPKAVDQDMRDEAAAELEKAIASTKLKLQNKEVDLATVHAPEDNEITRKQIAEVKEIIADMEQRLNDLKKPPMDVNSMLGEDNPMAGILGAALGESAAEKEARVEEAKQKAKDLSGLVRKKEKKLDSELDAAPSTETNGKRKAEEPAKSDEQSKKTKVEEDAAVSVAES